MRDSNIIGILKEMHAVIDVRIQTQLLRIWG